MSCLVVGLWLLNWLLNWLPLAHADFPPVPLDQVAQYTARKVSQPLQIDGKLDEAAWIHATRSPRFVDLISGQPTLYSTHAAVLWDEEYLYVGYWIEDPQVSAKFTERDSPIYQDNDVEQFIALNDAYYEFEINALGTIYEGLFIWQDRFRESGFHTIPELDPSLPQTKFQEFNGVGLTDHPRGKRWAYLHWDFPGLKSAVQIDGTLNDPSDQDRGWTVELAIPWSGFQVPASGDTRSIPPRAGDLWRMDFSRFNQFKADPPAQDSGGWAWSYHGVWDSHVPEVFPQITFSDELVASGPAQPEPLNNVALQGFPEPPPPYQATRAFPQLKLGKALAVGRIPPSPDSNSQALPESAAQPAADLWVITHDGDYGGPGRLYTFADQPTADSLQLALERPEILYGVAFDPQFAHNRFVYIGCNGDTAAFAGKATKVLRGKVLDQAGWVIDPESIITLIEWPSDGHNGGDLAFGNDGMLYVSAGDGTSDSDGNLAGQDLSTLPGSLLRIDVSGATAESPYRVPADNPFWQTPGARPEIWAYGLRNPWRITYDLYTDQLWIGNNGQDLWETAHLARRGENYGWSLQEGSHPFQPTRQAGPTPIVPPTLEHPHSEARSLTGGVVYHGTKFPELQGAYIYGDYATGNIWAARHNGTQVEWQSHLVRSSLLISGFGLDTRGELLIVDHQGGLYQLEPRPSDVSAVPFPRRLSETGIYADVASGTLSASFVPYSVQSPLWSDNAHKERHLAIPAGTQISLNGTLGWNFPAQSVLVKTFSFPQPNTDPNSPVIAQRRVETRLMVKVGNEWFGYSYRWLADQSDAELVDAGGAATTLMVHDAATHSTREQRWNFPSRSECSVCHTRAANYVLGLTTPQMNREHVYPALSTTTQAATNSTSPDQPTVHSVNQLQALAQIGWLKLDTHPGQLPQLTDPADTGAAIEARAKSYLVANCAHCHTNAGGGNSRLELVFGTATDKMMLVDQPPQHDRFGIDEARIIAPGAPERSILFHRLQQRGAGQMPPLATHLIDQQGLEIVRQWIATMTP